LEGVVLFPVLLPAGFDAAEVVTGHGGISSRWRCEGGRVRPGHSC
jgi:hypothetical protein